MYDIIIGRNESDRKKMGSEGTIFLGKHYVKMGQTTSLSNNVLMDVIRSHVVFVCGKRGGGKCLHSDTEIILTDGSVRKIKDIEQDAHGIASLSKDLRIEKKIKDGFYKRIVNTMFHIKMRSGKVIKLTPEHPLLTISGWRPVKSLTIGSRIAAPRRLPIFGRGHLNECRVKILAYLIAEGHLGNNFVLFSNKDSEIVKDFKNAVSEFDNKLSVRQHSKEHCYRVSANAKRTATKAFRDKLGRFIKGSSFEKSSIKLYMEKIGLYGLKSGQKFIPDIVFTSTRKSVSLFLNRLFSCDGTIYYDISTNSWRIAYASTSKRLIGQVQHLLSRFGVLGRIRQKTVGYEYETRGQNVSKFLEHIGFYGHKEKRAEKALQEQCSVRNPNVDTIPKEIWDLYRPNSWAEAGRAVGYSNPKSLRTSINYSVSRQKLMSIAVADENTEMQKLAGSDIFWDEITDIETLSGMETVYDITVPGNHNFIANDLIVHNSYTMGVITEGMAGLPDEIRQNLSIVILDTMGVYWTMKYGNRKDAHMLNEWKLEGRGLNVQIYTPTGFHKEYKEKDIPTDFPFSLKPSELDAGDWCLTFDVGLNDPMGVLIDDVIGELQKAGQDYSINDIIQKVQKETDTEKSVRQAVTNRFKNALRWGLFDTKGTKLTELAAPGQVTVLDVSCYSAMPNSWGVKSLVIGLVAKKLFIQRMVARKNEEYADIQEATHYFEDRPDKNDLPMMWLVVDEAHEFLPNKGKTAATDPLITILREGRQPGISLILASQQPGKIHTDVMTQSDTVIAHRLTSKIDIDSLGLLMQSYMRSNLNTIIDQLPRIKGAAIVFDDANEKMYPVQIRPRFTWHGGESPTAFRKKKGMFEGVKE